LIGSTTACPGAAQHRPPAVETAAGDSRGAPSLSAFLWQQACDAQASVGADSAAVVAAGVVTSETLATPRPQQNRQNTPPNHTASVKLATRCRRDDRVCVGRYMMRLILLINRSLVRFRYANRWIHLSERDEKEKEKAERGFVPRSA